MHARHTRAHIQPEQLHLLVRWKYGRTGTSADFSPCLVSDAFATGIKQSREICSGAFVAVLFSGPSCQSAIWFTVASPVSHSDWTVTGHTVTGRSSHSHTLSSLAYTHLAATHVSACTCQSTGMLPPWLVCAQASLCSHMTGPIRHTSLCLSLSLLLSLSTRASTTGGATFSQLARQHSICPSARQGGELGWLAPHQLPPGFEPVLSQPLGLSRATTARGHHLVTVLEEK